MTLFSLKRNALLMLLAIGLIVLGDYSYSETAETFSDSEVLQIQGESIYTSMRDSEFKERDAVTKAIVDAKKIEDNFSVSITKGNLKFYFDKYLLFMKDANVKKPKVLIDIETDGQLFPFDDFFYCRDSEGHLNRFDYKGNKTGVIETAGNTYVIDDKGAVYVEEEDGQMQMYRCLPNENELRLVYSGEWNGFAVEQGNLVYLSNNAFYENKLDGGESRLIYNSKDAIEEWTCFNHELYWMTFGGKALQTDLNGETVKTVFDSRVSGFRQVGKQLLFNVCEKEGGIYVKDGHGNAEKIINDDVVAFNILGDSVAYVNSAGMAVLIDLKTKLTTASDVQNCQIELVAFKPRLIQSAEGIVVHEAFGRIYKFDNTLKSSEIIETDDMRALGGSESYYYVNRETNELCKLNYVNGKTEILGTSFMNDDDKREYIFAGVKTKMVAKGSYDQLSIMDSKSGKVLLQKKISSKVEWLGGNTLLIAEKNGNVGIYNAKLKKYIDLKCKMKSVKGDLRFWQCGAKTVLMDDYHIIEVINNNTGESVLKDKGLKNFLVGEIKGTTLMLHEISDATITVYDVKTDKSVAFEFMSIPTYESAELIGKCIYFYNDEQLVCVYDTELKKIETRLDQ